MHKKIENEVDYEKNTEKMIVNHFNKNNINPIFMPGILVHSHGPFTWGKNIEETVYHAVFMEELAKMAFYTHAINPKRKYKSSTFG